MSKTTGKLNPLLRICPCTGNSLEGCFPDKSFPWEETESAFCKGLWKITPRIQILSKLCENLRHFTIKIFWLQKLANLSALLWKDAGKWNDCSLPQQSVALRKSLHFPLSWDLTSSWDLALCSDHCLLPPARILAAHWPAERCLLEHYLFTPKFLLLKLCPTGSIKKHYWGHSLKTWMSPPEFSCRDGSRREHGERAGISPKQAHGSSARVMPVPAALFSILG